MEDGNAAATPNDADSVKAIVICSGPENDSIDNHLKKVNYLHTHSPTRLLTHSLTYSLTHSLTGINSHITHFVDNKFYYYVHYVWQCSGYRPLASRIRPFIFGRYSLNTSTAYLVLTSACSGVTDDVVFIRVSKHRRPIEDFVFVVTLISFGAGYLACYYQSALGIQAHLSVTHSRAHSLYSFRFISLCISCGPEFPVQHHKRSLLLLHIAIRH